MKTILGFVPDTALWAVDDVGGNLLASVRRQAVEKDRLLRRLLHELRVHRVLREGSGALLLLLLLPHRRPDVGVDDIRAIRCFHRITYHTHLGLLERAREQMIGRLVALGAGER